MDIFSDTVQKFDFYYLLFGLAALVTIVFHELSHGFVAFKLGDPTAQQRGRLTLNPIKHIDIIGLIMLLRFGFGWAKPVPVDMSNFKNPKRGMAITALAGPVANFLLAFAALLIFAIMVKFGVGIDLDNDTMAMPMEFLTILADISIGLGIFNLIPIPPLDGSKILLSLLPDHMYYNVLRYEQFGMIILFVVLSTDIITPFLITARTLVTRLLLILVWGFFP